MTISMLTACRSVSTKSRVSYGIRRLRLHSGSSRLMRMLMRIEPPSAKMTRAMLDTEHHRQQC